MYYDDFTVDKIFWNRLPYQKQKYWNLPRNMIHSIHIDPEFAKILLEDYCLRIPYFMCYSCQNDKAKDCLRRSDWGIGNRLSAWSNPVHPNDT